MSATNIIYRELPGPLGTMIAGTTGDGLCFLEWHDRGGVERILDRVAKRFRRGTEHGDHPRLDELEKELAHYFEGKLTAFTVPIDVTGTPFETQVWNELQRIPYGKTRSYGEMAERLGRPGAQRAVGRANGANYLSIVIPCHRVIDAGGKLHGYGGGLWRKKYLLELEAGVEPAQLKLQIKSDVV